MPTRLGRNIEWRTWMVTRFLLVGCLCVAQFFFPSEVHADGASPELISSEQIKIGCRINFKKEIYENSNDPLSNPPFSLDLEWACDGKPPIIVDRYDVEGSSPEIVTVIFRKKRYIVILVKWTTSSVASNFEGDFYKCYVYRFVPGTTGQPFVRESEIMKKLGSGWDGSKDGQPVSFPLKDSASIRKLLTRLGY